MRPVWQGFELKPFKGCLKYLPGQLFGGFRGLGGQIASNPKFTHLKPSYLPQVESTGENGEIEA